RLLRSIGRPEDSHKIKASGRAVDPHATPHTQEEAMDIKPLFPTPLIRLDLGDGGMVSELRRIILAREAESPGTLHSNDGGWQSEDDPAAWSGSAGALLIAAMRETVDRFTGCFADGSVKRAAIDWRVQAWANVNRAGAGNHAHIHPGAFWSAC